MKTRTRSIVESLCCAATAALVACGPMSPDQAPPPEPLTRSQAAALAERHGHPRLTQALRDKGNVDPESGFEEKRVLADELAMVHLHVRQTHAGIPVWGGEAIVHLDRDGRVTAVTDDFLPRVHVDAAGLRASVAAPQAIDRALASSRIAAAELSVPAAADPWIFRRDGADHLAWRVRLVRTDGPNPSIPVVFVDARSGEELWRYDDLQTGTGFSTYSGTVGLATTPSNAVYQLRDPFRGNQQINNMSHDTIGNGALLLDADDIWGNGNASNFQTAGVDVHYAAAITWDYYAYVHGRFGIRGDGVGLTSRVHYGNNIANAYWDPNCVCLTYGDGSDNVTPVTSLDVVGHETTHGVTWATAGLVYFGESGGLNEASSDILGTAIEFYAGNSSDPGDYLIGEKVNLNGDGTPLRYMDQPSKDWRPGAPAWSSDCWDFTIGNKNPHHSSGVANHFFYLLAEGSGAKTINGVSYNSPTCNGSWVTGIGRDKAARIWYRALTLYMSSSTNYSGARFSTLLAAGDLYGVGSMEQNAVDAAWAAVGVILDAAVTSWIKVPDFVMPGQVARIKVTATNTGLSTWGQMFTPADNGFRLGAYAPTNEVRFTSFPQCGGYSNSKTDARAYTCETVLQGGTTTYSFDVRSPFGKTSAILSAQMVHDGYTWFGNTVSTTLSIGQPYCGKAVNQCVLHYRPDILQAYAAGGWNTSCANRDAIVKDWCAKYPAECVPLKSGPCVGFNNPTRCTNGVQVDGTPVDPATTFDGFKVCGANHQIWRCDAATAPAFTATGVSCF